MQQSTFTRNRTDTACMIRATSKGSFWSTLTITLSRSLERATHVIVWSTYINLHRPPTACITCQQQQQHSRAIQIAINNNYKFSLWSETHGAFSHRIALGHSQYCSTSQQHPHHPQTNICETSVADWDRPGWHILSTEELSLALSSEHVFRRTLCVCLTTR